jgi:hypothetical protein
MGVGLRGCRSTGLLGRSSRLPRGAGCTGKYVCTRRRAREGPGEGQGNPATNGASSALPGPPAAPVRHARVLIYPSRYAGAGLGSGGRCAGLSVVAGLQLQPTPGKLSAGLGC